MTYLAGYASLHEQRSQPLRKIIKSPVSDLSRVNKVKTCSSLAILTYLSHNIYDMVLGRTLAI